MSLEKSLSNWVDKIAKKSLGSVDISERKRDVRMTSD